MYHLILSLHLVAVMTWFAALFFLPRVFVYHAQARDHGDQQAMSYFQLMERRLYKGIMLPAMLAVIVFGGLLIYLVPSVMSNGSFHVKLLLVALLIGYHHVCLAYLKQFAAGRCQKSLKFLRIFNGIPILLLFAIILLVMFQPF
ncbi:putative membrane protein [Chromohalobacter marismortui]|uniref:Protoporphyrinogen IX oxidase n=1 Tax=Chromohalobacter marismortui TaxID=42055 RepID=A0A4R7NNQ6_9GAMM|nr:MULTISPECIES: CopD family protein [Chromohalobacter]MCI0509480.1 CopD family protein [Chromohalobacter sp.]MCI0592626.1 CopD family protein [Chromohalobacter sp.]TDU22199.1 putative membrane protein [Chromohalobacter marismortui]